MKYSNDTMYRVIIEDKASLKKNSLFGNSVKQTLEDCDVFAGKITTGKRCWYAGYSANNYGTTQFHNINTRMDTMQLTYPIPITHENR